MKISKYFWDLNEKALRETARILKDPGHPKFERRIMAFLSRCDKPKDLFSIISKQRFIEVWPRVRSYWFKVAATSDYRDWWETVYEQILEQYKIKKRRAKGEAWSLFLRIGAVIKEARLRNGLSQNDLAFRVGMKQPDISMIEKGRKNITIETLASLSKALNIEILKLK